MLYFVGHAQRDRNGMLYLAPHDAGNPLAPANSMVSIGDVYEKVAEQDSGAERKLLILDCCFSGSAIPAMPGEASTAGSERGWYVMAACSDDKIARADSLRETTFFTGALLEAFKGVKETRPSLSAQWIFETVTELVSGSPDVDGTHLVPQHAPATWADRPWLRNRLHVNAPRIPYTYPSLTAATARPQQPLPHGFRAWPSRESLFIGRTEELEAALGRFGQRTVLPVYGPRYAGKSAFVRQLLATPGVKESAPAEQPWLLLEIAIMNASAELPVLEALASALEVRLQDAGEQAGAADGDPRRELVIDRLREYARGRTLLLVIDCGRLGYDSHQVSGELDHLLAHPYFRDTANIIISRIRLAAHGDDQLDLQIPVRLGELQPTGAAELLTALMAHERVTVDGDDVLSRIQDHRLRLPGVLNLSTKGYLGSVDRDTTSPDPAILATALLEGTTPSMAKTLQELDCRLNVRPNAPHLPEPLAILVVWALSDQMSLPRHLLEEPSVAFPRRTLALLEDARVLSSSGSGHYRLGQASEQALRSLVIAALTREDVVEDPLAPPVLAPALLDDLFPSELDALELDCRFAAAAQVLLVAAAGALGADDDKADAAFQLTLRSAIGWIEDDGGNRLPRLHHVICSLVVAPAGDAPYLPAAAYSLGRPAVVNEQAATHGPAASPEGPADIPIDGEGITPLTAHYRLYHAVASLTFAARAQGTAAETGARFVAVAEEFSAALAVCEPEQVSHTLLRSADASLTFAGNRLGLRVRLLDTRLAAVGVLLLGARQGGSGQTSRITLTQSWLLNTADALIDGDRLEQAQELVGVVDELLGEELPHDGTSRSVHSRLQLNSRIARVRSRLLTDRLESRRELLNMMRSIVAGLELAHKHGESLSLWSTRLFESAVPLLQQSATDEELIETRSLVLDALRRCWGESRVWPSSICISTARLLRKVHVRCSDPVLKQNGAQEAVELLAQLPIATHRESVNPVGGILQPPSQAGGGAPWLNDRDAAQVLSSLAQAYGFLARTLQENERFGAAGARRVKAEEFARAAVALAPNAFSYSVWLRQVVDIRRNSPRIGADGEKAERRRRDCVREIRSWLARKGVRSHTEALLDLACLDSEWFEEGSLRSAAQRTGEEFLLLHPAVQRSRIEAIYRERQQKLKAHRFRYGPSIELCALETRLEREYRRWSGVLDFKVAMADKKKGVGPGPASKAPQVDNAPLFAIFHEAAALWPGNARLIAAEAAFHRYIWNYGQAIAMYEQLARTAPNGEIRHLARLSAAEAMLAELEYTSPEHRSSWQGRLINARDHLNGVLSRSSRVGLAAVLRERVAIRLGEPVNWEPIDAAFEAIVGGDYAGTVGRFLDSRHYGQDQGSDSVRDRVRITTRRDAEPLEQNRLRELLDGFVDSRATLKGTPVATEGGARDARPQPNDAGAFVSNGDAEQFSSDLLGELLLTDFTSVQLLTGLGKLYLDRAADLIARHQTLQGSEPAPDSSVAVSAAEHARRAYDCFDACRVLQEAHGNESIVTKFERGRAITLAAKYRHSADPFPRSLLHRRHTQIQQAVDLLLLARGHSVSGFNLVCSRAVAENNAVQASLGIRRPSGGS
ncbi:hypothetical protein [Micromonospora sp. WMMD812]|uniref:hypothetical protein n=1 Tax=Micromonospora sp. WMMD812 TaxID=3015152 RepID=UPI00248B12E5|nr:hypothetical protein [Micromonospora sp. WMMD812]WBB69079.1 hypothetical protein O7603_06935 [Micromonospora sp. WMMD812]